jgi:hypothetical protein
MMVLNYIDNKHNLVNGWRKKDLDKCLLSSQVGMMCLHIMQYL